jgi:prepilin peptidase CpaA
MQVATLVAAAILLLKAIAVVMLVRIAVTDFRLHKIYNDHLVPLLAVALALVVLDCVQKQSVTPAVGAGAAAALTFVALIGFWLAGKVGAGDVKLLTVAPLLVGYAGAVPMMIGLVVFTLATYLVMRFPHILPKRWQDGYAPAVKDKGLVPFGVPIAAAAILALVLPLPVETVPPPPPPVQFPGLLVTE